MKIRMKLKKLKRNWTKTDRLILKALYQEHRPMSKMEISKKSDVSWITVKKHMPSLVARGIVLFHKEGKRIYYRFNYEALV